MFDKVIKGLCYFGFGVSGIAGICIVGIFVIRWIFTQQP